MTAVAGLAVIALAVYFILRRSEVRLVLLLAALALGAVARNVWPVVVEFLTGFTDERFLLPLGTCMGFAYVLRHTGCDQHLVHLLTRPLRRVRFLLIPGAVLIAAAVNVPIISQSSTAIAVGTVLVPVLQAARFSPTTIAAALALGASVGGELLNPGAPELRTVASKAGATGGEVVVRVWPLLMAHLAVTVPIFWWRCARAEGKEQHPEPTRDEFTVNPLKAIVPLVPLVLLFAAAALDACGVFRVPDGWLVKEGSAPGLRDGRMVGLAMLIGVVTAALSSPAKAPQAAKVFFEGAGYALANITSLIVCANCFGAGVRAVGLAEHLRTLTEALPGVLYPLASLVPLGFAWASGSGMASTQSTYGFLYDATPPGADALRVGAVASLSAAAGRTLSPVAPVVLLSASMAGAQPLAMIRRTAPALLAGLIAVVILAMLLR